MAKIYYQEDCNLSLLEGKTIAVIGYGSQGHAHALNAKESGCHVIIGLYEGSKSWAKAEKQGFKVYTTAEAAKQADIIMILINDELQADVYKNEIEPYLEEHDVMLLENHGALAVGSDVLTAFYRMESLELWAKITINAVILGGSRDISKENIQKLIDLRGYYRVTGRHPGHKLFNPDDEMLHKTDE